MVLVVRNKCHNFSRRERILRGQRGTVLVQSAIVTVLLTMLISGVLDYGLLIKQDSAVVSSARVGARSAAQIRAASLPEDTTGALVCGVAKLTTRNFLSNAGLDPDQFEITIEKVDIPLIDNAVNDEDFKKGLRVKVLASAPSWYFWKRSAMRLVGSGIFAFEADDPDDPLKRVHFAGC